MAALILELIWVCDFGSHLSYQEADLKEDKEGPIHDVSWSPNSSSFAVVYGYMPAKTTLFNSRADKVHSFPLGPRNTVLFSPHGRFVLVAGFGNLAGQMDIYDLERDNAKICTIEASNASVCEWSPDGKHILTATTSPRLRVDNGIRIWHAGGGLMYNEELKELYHVCWRPQSAELHPLEGNPFSPMPTPHASALEYLGTVKTPSKPAGAYRPPGARGQVTPLAFRREDEGGAAYVRDGISSFSSNINGFGKPRRREVPGAELVNDSTPLPPGAAPGGGVSLTPSTGEDGEKLSKAAAKNKKKREAKKAKEAAEKETGNGSLTADVAAVNHRSPNRSPERRTVERQGQGHSRSRSKPHLAATNPDGKVTGEKQLRSRSRSVTGRSKQKADTNSTRHLSSTQNSPLKSSSTPIHQKAGQPSPIATSMTVPIPPPQSSEPPELQITSPTTPGGTAASGQDKKVRGLLKKIRAIDDLKMRLASGEKLEETQMKKIQTEDAVRRELTAFGL